jgi:hypothetical protein
VRAELKNFARCNSLAACPRCYLFRPALRPRRCKCPDCKLACLPIKEVWTDKFIDEFAMGKEEVLTWLRFLVGVAKKQKSMLKKKARG